MLEFLSVVLPILSPYCKSCSLYFGLIMVISHLNFCSKKASGSGMIDLMAVYGFCKSGPTQSLFALLNLGRCTNITMWYGSLIQLSNCSKIPKNC